MAAFSPKSPQNSPSSTQGRSCKIGAFFGTSNHMILYLNFYISTKFEALIPYHLQDHNIQSWKKKFFSTVLEGYSSVLWA
jgi:hypothetical protein